MCWPGEGEQSGWLDGIVLYCILKGPDTLRGGRQRGGGAHAPIFPTLGAIMADKQPSSPVRQRESQLHRARIPPSGLVNILSDIMVSFYWSITFSHSYLVVFCSPFSCFFLEYCNLLFLSFWWSTFLARLHTSIHSVNHSRNILVHPLFICH